MTSIVFYSNYCENSKSLIATLAKSQIKERLHYLCIDNRIKKPNGSIYIVLENQQEIILPPNIGRVPALLLLSKKNEVVTGKESILQYLQPQEKVINQQATNSNGEPSAYAFSFGMGGGSSLSVVSDNYSFYNLSDEQTNKAMSAAEGNGGLMQMHHYAALYDNQKIFTPPDNYVPDKVGEESIKNYQQARNLDVPQKR